MRRHADGFGYKLRQAGEAISDAFRNVTGKLTRSSKGNGRTLAGGRTRGARQPQGPTPVLGAPGMPIRSSAAMNSSTAHNTQSDQGNTKRASFGKRRVGLANKKRFAISMSAVAAAVLVPVFATSALQGGSYSSHGVSVNRPAALVAEEEAQAEAITLGAYASGTIVEQVPTKAAPEPAKDPQDDDNDNAIVSARSAVTDDNNEAADNSEETEDNGEQTAEPEEESSAADDENAEESTEPEPTATEDNTRALEPGTHSDAVIELQQRLMELHYMENDEPTDYYGPQTQQAVAYFQRKNGLTVDGYAGPETQDKLYSGEAKVYTVADGAEGADVWDIQERLAELGYPVNVTGYYGSQTSDAVKYFQRMNGITDDGSVGTDTKDVLFSSSAEPAIPPEPDPEPEPETQSEEGQSSSEGSSESSSSSSESSSSESSESSSKSESSSSSSKEESSSKSEESSSKKHNDDEEEEEEKSSSKSGGGSAPAANSGSVEAFVEAACAQEGKPYVLGGKGPNTFDCSGLVYYALKASGNGIGYMTSGGWAGSGYPSISWDNLQRGDVLCFSGHVGVYLGGGMMCDASSSNGQIMIRSMGNWARNNFICGKRPL